MGTMLCIALSMNEMDVKKDQDNTIEYKLLKDNIISKKEYDIFKTNKKMPIINGKK